MVSAFFISVGKTPSVSDLLMRMLKGVLIPLVIPFNILFETSSNPLLFLLFSLLMICSIFPVDVGVINIVYGFCGILSR